MQCEIYFAVPMPSIELLETDILSARERLYDTLDELNSLSGRLLFDLYEFGSSRPTIEFIEAEKSDQATLLKLQQWFERSQIEDREFIRASIEVAEDDKLPRIYQSVMLRAAFEKRITDLLLIANLCRIGSIEVADSVILVDGQLVLHSSLPKINCLQLQRAALLVEKNEWPSLRTILIEAAWEWAVAHKADLGGFNGTPLGRALGAYSRLLEPAEGLDEAMHLVWSLIGIEALYVRGKTSVMEQVREKIYAFLGQPKTHKKQISSMYNFRSRFIHGDLDFAPLGFEFDASPEAERYDKEQCEAIDIAVSVLAATLQEIISRNWSGLSFSYTISDTG